MEETRVSNFQKRRRPNIWYTDRSLAEARKLFDEGWSLPSAFSRSGHPVAVANNLGKIDHPIIKQMIADNKIRRDQKFRIR